MVATFISGANTPTSGDSQSSSRAVTKPAGAIVGVFFVSFWNFTGAITAPSGAVLRSNNTNGTERTATYIKYVSGDATGTTYTFSWTGSQWSALKAIFYSDVDTGLDLSTVPFDSDTDASGTNFPSSTVDTVTGAALAWCGNTFDYSSPPTHTPPTNFTETGDTDGSAAAYRISPSDGAQAASGATNSNSINKLTSLVAIAPAGGGGGTQTVLFDALTVVSTLFNPSIVPGQVNIVAQAISVVSSIFNPTVKHIAQPLHINAGSTIFSPSVAAGPIGVVTNLLVVAGSIHSPSVSNAGSIVNLVLDAPSILFNPSIVRLLDIIQMLLVSIPSTVYSPQVTGGDGGTLAVALGSIADTARSNMLVELGLTEPQLLSNVDLTTQVRADETQTTFTLVPEWTPAKQYWEYLKILRG